MIACSLFIASFIFSLLAFKHVCVYLGFGVCVIVCWCKFCVCARTRMWVLFDMMNERMVKCHLCKPRHERNPVLQTKLERRWEGSETSCRDPVTCFPGPVDLNITFNKSRPWQDQS
jgi:hypothetical protein